MVRYNSLLNFGKLLQQLKSFGLDPSEWQIHDFQTDRNLIYLSNRLDPDFRIAGKYHGFASAKPLWTEIYLASV